MELDPSQQAAVELMRTVPFGVVTGGPGTGKTTTLRTALDALDEAGVMYELAAPTGKAARRMQEATGRAAQTIHRLLEYNPSGRGYGKSDGFLVNADNPLECDAVFVDESSMIDVELGAALLDAVQAPTRLVLIGDAAQLPPVGPGRPFADLIESGHVPVAHLTTLHRAAAESWVCSQAPKVLRGELPDLRERDDFLFLEHDVRDRSVDALIETALDGLARTRGVVREEAQILVPQNVGPAGAEVINRRMQAALNPPGDQRAWKVGKKQNAREIREGDRVIQTRNDYLRDVMNGEIGIVIGAAGNGACVARFDDREVEVDRDGMDALHLAYALTTHKYQGSEIPWALVLCHSTHTRMLTRTWLYTSITRAKRGVVLVGDRVGVERAVKNALDAKRNSGLVDRLTHYEAA